MTNTEVRKCVERQKNEASIRFYQNVIEIERVLFVAAFVFLAIILIGGF